MSVTWYPSVDEIVALNSFVLRRIVVKRADSPRLLSYTKLVSVIESVQNTKGSVYAKAAVLLLGLVQAHVFASGNRRTALAAVKEFVVRNGGQFAVENVPKEASTLVGIREGFYTLEDISAWLKHGKIREFKRKS
ncbi:MAG: Fic family protein [Candidatus Woesearchaeota archaeon]